MAQFQPAFEYMMDNEDNQREYAVVPDTGGHAISGINSASFPDAFAKIAAMPQASRGPAVSAFYQEQFWTPLYAGGLTGQDVANRLLDQAVNGGLREAQVLLQRAVNACGATPPLVVDGAIGPVTLEAANALDPDKLVAAYRSARVGFYAAVLQTHPDDAVYKTAWMTRAEA